MSAIFWLIRWNCKVETPHLALLIALWLVLTSAFLAGVYHLDRAGWNWFLITGLDVTIAENYPELIDLSPEEFVSRFAMFSLDELDSNVIMLTNGGYDFNQTVIVPKGALLMIEPGTTLRFGPGCSLISYSPIIARGTIRNPVTFRAQSRLFKWGVVGVVQAGKSIFEYVFFENARQALVNGVDFFAGLSIIESQVEITHCQFTDMYGKDAVNVRYGNTLMKNNVFKNAYKDGVDLDGGSGEISHNLFINCQDEGIDLSENFNILVFENKIFDKKGGRIGAENNLEEIISLNTLDFLKN
ncbi:MAG: right-handed parallel beta-helix repeat-containing protein [bacterium]